MDKIIKTCNLKCTEEQRASLEEKLNRFAMEILEQNLPACEYDTYVLAHGKQPIKVEYPED